MRLFFILSAIGICLLLFFIWFLFMSILTISVRLSATVHHVDWQVEISLWGRRLRTLRSERRNDPAASEECDDQSEDAGQEAKNISFAPEQWAHGYSALCRLVTDGKLTIRKLVWSTVCGTGDAAETACLSGTLWCVIAVFFPALIRLCADQPRITVIPSFQQAVFRSRLSCMFQIRIGDAILMIRAIKRQGKEGEA